MFTYTRVEYSSRQRLGRLEGCHPCDAWDFVSGICLMGNFNLEEYNLSIALK
jgi:hypothetical protein